MKCVTLSLSRSLRVGPRFLISESKGTGPPDLLSKLDQTFTWIFDSQKTRTSFSLKTLLDCTETSHEVRILTTPYQSKLDSLGTFEKVKDMLQGSTLVYNLEPSQCHRLDRQFLHLEMLADARNSGQFPTDQESDELALQMNPESMNPSFYKNIFN